MLTFDLPFACNCSFLSSQPVILFMLSRYKPPWRHGTAAAENGQVTLKFLHSAVGRARSTRQDCLESCWQYEKELAISCAEVEEISGLPVRSATIADIHNSPTRHCCELGYKPHNFLKKAQVLNLKIFWKWTLNCYKRIDAASSLRNYWRVLRMHILDKADQALTHTREGT